MNRKVLFRIMILLVTILCVYSLYLFAQGREDKRMTTYSLDQFSNIAVSVSTLDDIQKIACIEKMYITSFGSVVEFPTRDGRWIQIRLLGPDLVVESIGIVDSSWG